MLHEQLIGHIPSKKPGPKSPSAWLKNSQLHYQINWKEQHQISTSRVRVKFGKMNQDSGAILWYPLSLMASWAFTAWKLGEQWKLLKCDCEGRHASRLYTWDVNCVGVVWQMSHRSYRPVLPTGNKLLQKKWDQTYYDEHRRLVRNCQPNHLNAYSWPYIALFPGPSHLHLIVSSDTKLNISFLHHPTITNPPPSQSLIPYHPTITNPLPSHNH